MTVNAATVTLIHSITLSPGVWLITGVCVFNASGNVSWFQVGTSATNTYFDDYTYVTQYNVVHNYNQWIRYDLTHTSAILCLHNTYSSVEPFLYVNSWLCCYSWKLWNNLNQLYELFTSLKVKKK